MESEANGVHQQSGLLLPLSVFGGARFGDRVSIDGVQIVSEVRWGLSGEATDFGHAFMQPSNISHVEFDRRDGANWRRKDEKERSHRFPAVGS